MKFRHLLVAASLFAVCLVNTAQANLYEQPLLEGPGFIAISDTIDGSTGRRAYDNFIISSTANLLTVTWWGCIIDEFAPYDNPAPYDIENWEISIWNNNGGLPGQQLFSEFRSDAEVSRELVASPTDPVLGTILMYRFDLTLSSSFLLQADTEYWLAIMAFSTTGNPWAKWNPSIPGLGDDLSVSLNLGTGAYNFMPEDRAFVLGGDVVPLPAAVWLLVSALAVIGLAPRRRQ